MKHWIPRIFLATACIVLIASTVQAKETLRDQAIAAMKKSATFFHDKVSTQGGYLMEYTSDLSLRYGELPAWKSQIWVQNPSTPGMGEVFLSAFLATGDSTFLRYSEDAAKALVRGQLTCGGWNYLIDFEPAGLEAWYKESKVFVDYPEFMHYYGNATFDDKVTFDATRLLLHLYDKTSNPVWLVPLNKALEFVLKAQYPSGGWPQRYPLIGTGYENYYTFNDGVIHTNIQLMIEAYKILGDPRFLESARRGADFIIVSQHASPQSGWPQQCDMNMRPAWAREGEPPSLCSQTTRENIDCLMIMYEFTGDRRYLEPIPRAIVWMDSIISPKDEVPLYLEEDTNRPLAAKFEGDSGRPETIKITYNLAEAFEMNWILYGFNVKGEKEWYEKLSKIPWTPPAKPAPLTQDERLKTAAGLEQSVHQVIGALDSLGRWTEDGRMYTKRRCFKNTMEYQGPVIKNAWIHTETFMNNFRCLTDYVRLTDPTK